MRTSTHEYEGEDEYNEDGRNFTLTALLLPQVRANWTEQAKRQAGPWRQARNFFGPAHSRINPQQRKKMDMVPAEAGASHRTSTEMR